MSEEDYQRVWAATYAAAFTAQVEALYHHGHGRSRANIADKYREIIVEDARSVADSALVGLRDLNNS